MRRSTMAAFGEGERFGGRRRTAHLVPCGFERHRAQFELIGVVFDEENYGHYSNWICAITNWGIAWFQLFGMLSKGIR